MDPVTLTPADYWELRARLRDVEAVKLDLLKQRLEGERRLSEARAAAGVCEARVRAKYALPDVEFGWNDETLELIPVK